MSKTPLPKRRGDHGQMPSANGQKKKSRPFGFLTSAELDAKKWPLKWLVEGVFVQNQAGMIGGPVKSLKTSIVIDLAVSLGSRKPFLGKFAVPRERRVAMFSGETVRAAFQQTARRICSTKGTTLAECGVLWSFDLPRLSIESDVRRLGEFLRSEGVDVVVIDPLYLSLGPGFAGSGVTNLFETGPLLRGFSTACLNAGATPFFLHHMSKGSRPATTRQDGHGAQTRASLNDLAYAGFAEFARQWLLISPNAPFDPIAGRSDLTIGVGSSAGQSGQWRVVVTEGTMNSDFSGRKWEVQFPGTSPESRSRHRSAEVDPDVAEMPL